jgi:hypothetical protein
MTRQLIYERKDQLVSAALHPPSTDGGAQPERPRPGRSHTVSVAVPCLLTAGAVAPSVDLADMTGLGLISAALRLVARRPTGASRC